MTGLLISRKSSGIHLKNFIRGAAPKRLSKKLKSINHKGAQTLRNSPVGYFSEGASLQRWHFTSRSQRTEIHYFNFVYFEPTLRTLWLKLTFSTAVRGQNRMHYQQLFLLFILYFAKKPVNLQLVYI